MQISIRDASKFVIGAGMMLNAVEAAGNTGITFDHLAATALTDDADGQKLRLSIETLADQESEWLRSTPLHILASDRVMQGRGSEVTTFITINSAVLSTYELADRVALGDSEAKRELQDKYVAAFNAIDVTPGSTNFRRRLETGLVEQTTTATAHGDLIRGCLKESETAYLNADAAAILDRYSSSVEPSEDYTPN